MSMNLAWQPFSAPREFAAPFGMTIQAQGTDPNLPVIGIWTLTVGVVSAIIDYLKREGCLTN